MAPEWDISNIFNLYEQYNQNICAIQPYLAKGRKSEKLDLFWLEVGKARSRMGWK